MYYSFLEMPREEHMTAKIDSFLSNPDAGTLTGERRMGPENLLDLLADHIMKDDSANIIRITDAKNVSEFIGSKRIAGKTDHILIYIDLSPDVTKDIITLFPDTHIYKAKELCHQLPVCFRETATSCDLTCRVPHPLPFSE
jgi:hypothetical protein